MTTESDNERRVPVDWTELTQLDDGTEVEVTIRGRVVAVSLLPERFHVDTVDGSRVDFLPQPNLRVVRIRPPSVEGDVLSTVDDLDGLPVESTVAKFFEGRPVSRLTTKLPNGLWYSPGSESGFSSRELVRDGRPFTLIVLGAVAEIQREYG